MALFGKDLGIHLGTVNTVIVEGDQVVLHEPTVVAIDTDELKIVEVGQAAREMDGRTPEMIEVMRPLREGVIADFEVTQRMLGYFIEKVCGPARLFKPRVMITVPNGATSVESRAVHEAALQAGCREVHLVQEPLAAAIGIGLPIATPSGNMVVCLGGGASQAGVLAMSGIVTAHTVRSGGTKLDEAIGSYVRKKYGLVIGARTAEEAKIVEYVQKGETPPWRQVNQLPAHVYFSHQTHAVSAAMECAVCHGEMQKLTAPMPRPFRNASGGCSANTATLCSPPARTRLTGSGVTGESPRGCCRGWS